MQYEVAIRVYQGISWFIRALQLALMVYVVLSWIARPYSKVYIFVRNLVSPLLAPFRPLGRKLMEKGLMVDLSVLFAWLALTVVQRLLGTIIFRLFGLY